jgi:hypothetical protein
MPGRWLLLNYKWLTCGKSQSGRWGERVQFPVPPAGGPEAGAAGRSGLVLTCKCPGGEVWMLNNCNERGSDLLRVNMVGC